jgi:hypothetical protein
MYGQHGDALTLCLSLTYDPRRPALAHLVLAPELIAHSSTRPGRFQRMRWMVMCRQRLDAPADAAVKAVPKIIRP